MSDDERPLAIDMFCGISGWGAGLIAAGFRVIGFDIENMFKVTGEPMPEHFSLVIQDVLTIHGSQFKDAALIVSSSPCQAYSWMAMPWSLAKAKRAAILADQTGEAKRKLNELFDAQFRIQREACEAAGRHIPMIVENVRGAQEWVGQAKDNYGSYYLWGDVPMIPSISGGGGRARQKSHPGEQWNINRKNFTGTQGWDPSERAEDGRKVPGFRFDGSGKSFQTASVAHHALEGRKNGGGSWFNIGSPGQKIVGQNPVHSMVREGVKVPSEAGRSPTPGLGARFTSRDCGAEAQEGRKGASGAWFNDHKKRDVNPKELLSANSSKSSSRKAASAAIAKIPFALSKHIGEVFHPRASERYAMARVRQSCLFGDDA